MRNERTTLQAKPSHSAFVIRNSAFPFRAMRLWTAFVGLLVYCAIAHAGGGPENVLVVVNSRSWASQTVANHFIRLRHVPPSNVLYLDWDEGPENTDVEKFRQKILGPILLALEQRALATQIDAIIYSSDFPWSVWLKPDLGARDVPAQVSPTASINGATYFWQRVMIRNPTVIGLENNRYLRNWSPNREHETRGFRSWYGWGPDGALLESGGEQYMLSSMLAVTSGRGLSVREAIAALQRSAAADFTVPSGTIYYCDTSDVRARARAAGFARAVAELTRLGIRAEVIRTTLPDHESDVQGLMTGAANFNWPASGSTIRPGAFCDNLTSFGGDLSEGTGQTKITEFLRYGAAGSSGAVVEPFSIPHKFPTADVQVHYARGCTLAEAYYQSVFGPYQLLLVADPLCQPWARPPRVELAGTETGATLSGVAELTPKLVANSPPVARYELFVDGRRELSAVPGNPLRLDTTRLADGFHELSLVGIGTTAIETQGRITITVIIANRGRRIALTSSASTGSVRWGEKLKLTAKVSRPASAQPQIGIVFTHNGRLLGKAAGDSAQVELDPRLLGLGPVQLQAIGVGREGPSHHVMSSPLQIKIDPPAPQAAMRGSNGELLRGMQLTLPGPQTVPIQETRKENWLAEAGVKPGNAFTLRGIFEVDRNEVYQFQVAHGGALELRVGNSVLYREARGDFRRQYVPISLAKGRHELVVTGKAGDQVQLQILFGGPGATSLDGVRFRQPGK